MYQFIFRQIIGLKLFKRMYLTNKSVGKHHQIELENKDFNNCVNSIPLAERFNLDLLQTRNILPNQFYINGITSEIDSIAICCQQNIDNQNINNEEFKPPEISEFYVFADGVVTFWNIEFIYQLEPLNQELSSLEEEIMNIKFTTNNSNADDDTIYLNDDIDININLNNKNFVSYHQLERFAFSHAMAASVRMGIWERELDELNDELERCIEQLKEGKLIWNASKARQTIGKIASIRHSVNSTELRNKDIYWDLMDIERIYESLAKQLKLQSRQHELNKRIDYCEYFAKTIHEMLDQKHSHRLEWIIILLIFVEILINLPKIVGMFSIEEKTIKS